MIGRLKQFIEDARFGMRAAQPGIRAARLYGHALNLEKRGRDQEAFKVIGRALALLPKRIEPDAVDMAATLSGLLVMTVSYAQLSSKLGTPHAAADAIKEPFS
jgi:hypothetical protein